VDRELGDGAPPVIAGIWPLVSARNAEFLANEVPGVTVPDVVLDRMRRANARSKEHAVAEGSPSRARCSSGCGRSCRGCR
jgi:homocysteine S-methyltransferase